MSAVCCSSTHIVSTEHEAVGLWLQAQGAAYYRQGSTCLGLARDGQLVAATLYDNYNGASIFANIAITGPITRRWLWAIFHYPFVQLGVYVICGLVAEGNTKSCHLVERLGFTLTATIPQADPSGALLLYTMPKANCRFLTGRYAHG
jgi:hypothetical protein